MRRRSWFIPLIHVLIWLVYLALPFLLHSPPPAHHDAPPSPERGQELNNQWTLILLLMNVLMLPVFYLNVQVLTVRLLNRRRYWLFVLAQAAMLGAFYVVTMEVARWMQPERHRPIPLMLLVFNYALVMMAAIAYRLTADRIRQDHVLQARENETLKSELQFLRWQISPHFLFNVLNNFVALARVKSDRLEPMLLSLSSLMRYMLYETDERKVTLAEESRYLQDYIALQTMRFGDSVAVFTDIRPGGGLHTIEPMLLIPFVENAFKHGTGLIESPEIHLSFSVVHDTTLHFSVRNKHTVTASIQDATHGIGLSNVQRRLNLIYPDRYKLTITRDEHWFAADLQLQLV